MKGTYKNPETGAVLRFEPPWRLDGIEYDYPSRIVIDSKVGCAVMDLSSRQLRGLHRAIGKALAAMARRKKEA